MFINTIRNLTCAESGLPKLRGHGCQLGPAKTEQRPTARIWLLVRPGYDLDHILAHASASIVHFFVLCSHVSPPTIQS